MLKNKHFLKPKTLSMKINKYFEENTGNTFYGIGLILKRYAGLPAFVPLNCTIQHGVDFFSSYPSLKDYRQSLNFYISKKPNCPFLMYNAKDEAHLIKNGIKNVKAIGAPIIYMDDYIHGMDKYYRKGTIIFPQKSTHNIDLYTDFSSYADQLLKLPERFHPLKVCMYFLDIEKGYANPFLQRGIKVVCNGNLYSQDFLYNFVSNALPCEYATTNHLGTFSATYYAIYLGLKFFHYGPSVKFRFTAENDQVKYGRDRDFYTNYNPYFFGYYDVENHERQLAIAKEVLGANLRLSRLEMRNLLLQGINTDFIIRYIKNGIDNKKNQIRAILKRITRIVVYNKGQ